MGDMEWGISIVVHDFVNVWEVKNYGLGAYYHINTESLKEYWKARKAWFLLGMR